MAALDCLIGLPEGYLALNLEGRITFLTPSAAELLGDSPSQLLGRRAWEALPWLNTPRVRGPLPGGGDQPGGHLLHRPAAQRAVAGLPALSRADGHQRPRHAQHHGA
ncbi:PAS domain-containing protein [Nonomuraea ferruginea]